MERSRVILIGVFFALIGAVVPIALMAYVSWSRAVEHEKVRLEEMAGRVVDRANLSVSETAKALKELSSIDVPPCSAEHILLMRRMTVNTRSVEAMGYFRDQLLRCTSWGKVSQEIHQDKADFVTSAGVGVTTKTRSFISGGDSMMALQYGHHNAMINIGRFVDVMVDSGIHLALARADGVLVAESSPSQWSVVHELLLADTLHYDEKYFYGKVARDGWIGIAVEDKEHILSDLRGQLLWTLPLGAFISVFIVFLVVRLSRKNLSFEAELALAVKRREFVVHYQPIMELKSGRCVGAEALVRWQRPDGTMVAPDLFIPLAEKNGLILPITDQVIEAVVRDLSKALVNDRSLHIAINLCADDIKTGRILPVMSLALEHTGIHAEQIWLEATERGFMDIESARETLAKARDLGHLTAIDDFGTGFSSLQYLQELPLDALKIDKSFVNTIGTASASSSVIGHIIEMAKGLRFFIVAEGVETTAQAEYLAERGVDFVQGWLYSKALPVHEFLHFYSQRTAHLGEGPKIAQRGHNPVVDNV